MTADFSTEAMKIVRQWRDTWEGPKVNKMPHQNYKARLNSLHRKTFPDKEKLGRLVIRGSVL